MQSSFDDRTRRTKRVFSSDGENWPVANARERLQKRIRSVDGVRKDRQRQETVTMRQAVGEFVTMRGCREALV